MSYTTAMRMVDALPGITSFTFRVQPTPNGELIAFDDTDRAIALDLNAATARFTWYALRAHSRGGYELRRYPAASF